MGIVSVALCAPTVEGSYTSHWRLAHTGEQFGPRVWCSVVVDPLAPAPMMADGIIVSPCVTPQVKWMDGCRDRKIKLIDVHNFFLNLLYLQGKNPVAKDGKVCAPSREQALMSVDQEEYYIPSVDLLTAQVIISSYTAVHLALRLQQRFISTFFYTNITQTISIKINIPIIQ